MNHKIQTKILAALATLLLMLQGLPAATLLLTNSDIAMPGAGGLWSSGANWLGGVAPGPGDTVVLSNSVPALAAVTSPNVGGYYTYVKGLAPDYGWTNQFDGPMPATSMVDSMTIGALWVAHTNSYFGWVVGNQATNEGAHDIYITNQLNIVSSVPRDLFHIYSNTVAVGTGFDFANMLAYATIQGPGSLNVTNPVGCLWVGQGSQTVGTATTTHAAILDMTGLNTFNCVLSNLCIAADFNTVNSGTDPNLTGYARPQGCLFLALTNYITLLDTNMPAYIVGFENNNNGSSFCISNCLGLVNYINCDQILVGGPKTSFSAGGMFFMPGYNTVAPLTNCYAKFRNIDGVSRQTAWALGDDSLSLGTTTTTYGKMDFTRGGVDALVDTIYLGRGGLPLVTSGIGVGNLIVGAGTTNLTVIDVNQMEVGDMLNPTAPCQGQFTVYSNATLNVNNYIRLINVPPGVTNSSTTRGFMFVYGGTVNVSGNILNNASPGGGFSLLYVSYGGTLNMQPAVAKPAGNISVCTLQLSKGTLTNFATLNVSNLVVLAPNTDFALGAGQALSPAGLGIGASLYIGQTNLAPGTTYPQLDGTILTNNGNGLVSLSLSNSALVMDVGSSSDAINVSGALNLAGVNQIYVNPVAGFGAGTYTILTYNTNPTWVDYNGNPNYGLNGSVTSQLVAGGPITNSAYTVTFDSSTPGLIKMIVGSSGSTSLTWAGGGSGNIWDVVGVNNWKNGATPSAFYQFDAVTFDDTGSATLPVNLSTTVNPSAVNCNASKNYIITGAGQIAGTAALVKNGTGSLTLVQSNSYTGGTTITSGTLRLGDGATVTGAVGPGPVAVGGTLAIAVPTNQVQRFYNILSGSGQLAVEGPGTVMLSLTNTGFTGTFKVSGGVLAPSALAAFIATTPASSKQIYVTNSGTLDINGLAMSNYVTISGTGLNGNGALVNTGPGQGNSLMQVFLGGNAAVGGLSRMDLNNVGSVTPGGVTGNGYTLTKLGTNCVSLFNSATNNWTNGFGAVTVSAGVLRLQNGTVLSSNPAMPLTVAGGATFELNNVWQKAPVIVTATLLDGACLYGTGGTGTNINGSVFTNVQANLFTGPITLNGTDVMDTTTNSLLQVNGVIGGGGNLTKGIGSHSSSATTAFSTGTGTLVLGGANTFTGNLTIQTGTLVLTNGGSVAAAANIILAGGVLDAGRRTDGTITVGVGQTLSGIGSVLGTVVVPTNAFLVPGILLSNLGSSVLAGTTTMAITKTNGVTGSSWYGVSGSLKLGGKLTVGFTGSGLAVGDKFQLFSAGTISSNFTAVTLPSNVVWTDNTKVDGSITVASLVTQPATPPVLAAGVTNGVITLSWPGNYSSYVLQGQTNSTTIGLSTNWVTIPTTGNTVSLPVNPLNPSVFYRLLSN